MALPLSHSFSDLGVLIRIEQKSGLGYGTLTMGPGEYLIELECDQPEAGKHLSLLQFFMQIALMQVEQTGGVLEDSGDFIAEATPTLMALLVASGLWSSIDKHEMLSFIADLPPTPLAPRGLPN